MSRTLAVVLAYLLSASVATEAGEVKAPNVPASKVLKSKKMNGDHLENWEIEVLEKLQLLENLELLQKLDLFKEDFAVLGVEDQP